MKIALLSRHLEERKTVPVMCVERIVPNIKWDLGDDAHCFGRPYGEIDCRHRAEFLIYPLGSKRARAYCSDSHCIVDALKTRLPRPAGEAEAIDAKRIEKIAMRSAIAEAKKAHDAARLCEAHARTLSGYCERPPKFLVEAYSTEPQRFCAHHTVRWRKHPVSIYDGRGKVEYRPREIKPL